MAKRNVMLADTWDESMDPKGWLISEKFDGRRIEWNGKQLLSSSGGVIKASASFLAELPPVPLDGEAWLGRGDGNLQDVGFIAADVPDPRKWARLKFVVFDLPDPAAGVFSERWRIVQGLKLPEHVQLASYLECTGREQFDAVFEALVLQKAEGVMLRHPDNRYVRRRVGTLLKRKKFHDAEALVIGHQPGEKACEGMLGALQCRLDNGIEFEIGTGFTNEERRNPPPIGSRVQFRYQELSRDGRPIGSPSYQGIRPEE
jgi:DNA ligase-1